MAPPTCTTSNGAPMPRFGLTASATAGSTGPMLLQDFEFIDHLSHFNRERVPQRVVYAKGGGAFGYFEVTHPEITVLLRQDVLGRGQAHARCCAILHPDWRRWSGRHDA
jgi:catalase